MQSDEFNNKKIHDDWWEKNNTMLDTASLTDRTCEDDTYYDEVLDTQRLSSRLC